MTFGFCPCSTANSVKEVGHKTNSRCRKAAEFYGQTALICPFLLGYVCLLEGNKGGGKKFTCLKGRCLCTEWKKIWLPERQSAYEKEKKRLPEREVYLLASKSLPASKNRIYLLGFSSSTFLPGAGEQNAETGSILIPSAAITQLKQGHQLISAQWPL